jgi:CCR4-NOT transcription complex subunit 10
LEFASLCLRNALALIDHHAISVKKSHEHFSDTSSTSSLGSNNGSKTTSWTNVEEGAQCNPSKPMDAGIFEKLKTAVLAAYSYVSICLGEYMLGLKYAKELLLIKNLPETHL